MRDDVKKDQFHKWAFDISENPRAYPAISVGIALTRTEPTRDRARELRMYDLIGEKAPEVVE